MAKKEWPGSFIGPSFANRISGDDWHFFEVVKVADKIGRTSGKTLHGDAAVLRIAI
ncbi:MAG: hypothetical protein WEB58_09345 [Planctomycetaceae bacterium]